MVPLERDFKDTDACCKITVALSSCTARQISSNTNDYSVV